MSPQPIHKGEYPPDWPSIAERVKERAGWHCARCGHANCRESGHVLTVHHFDGDKSNVNDWNLMPLCQRCHLSVQARVNPEITLLTAHRVSTWAMPFIAAYWHHNPIQPTPVDYHLSEWIVEYEREVGEWPEWAPRASA